MILFGIMSVLAFTVPPMVLEYFDKKKYGEDI